MIIAADIEGGRCLTLDMNYLSENMQRVIKDIKWWSGDNGILRISSLVPIKGEMVMASKTYVYTKLVKVSLLSNNSANQSDIGIAWIMFHNIYEMCRHLKQK